MAIKTFTVSALTSGALVLAYAAWSKWGPYKRLVPQPIEPALKSEPQPASEAAAKEAAPEVDSVDVVLDDLWAIDEATPNPNEQLVDFSTEPGGDEDDDETCVAPEGLGVRWLTRATEAMSPFHHALSVRDEAEAALLEGIAQDVDAQSEDAPQSSQRSKDGDFDVEFPAEKRGG